MITISFAVTSAVVAALLFGAWTAWLGYLVGRQRSMRAAIGRFSSFRCPLCGEMTDEPISYWRHRDHPKGKCTETFYGPLIVEELAALEPGKEKR